MDVGDREDEVLRGVVVTNGSARAGVPCAHLRRLCEGHFPDDPLVPGAYLLGLMADLAARLATGRQLAEVVRGVLVSRVNPDDEVVVSAIARPGTGAVTIVDAEVHVGARRAAGATLRFDETP